MPFSLFASYLAAVTVLFIAWIYLTIGAVAEHVTIFYWLRTILIHASCRWGSILSWMTTIGFFCGWIVTSKYAYLFSIPFTLLFSVFNHWILCDRGTLGFENCWFARLICLQRVEIGSTSLVFRGPLFGRGNGIKNGICVGALCRICRFTVSYLSKTISNEDCLRIVHLLIMHRRVVPVCTGNWRPAVYVYIKSFIRL